MLIERTILVSSGTDSTWISVADAARELRLSQQTIRRYLKSGILPYRKFGRTVRVLAASLGKAEGVAA